MIFLAPVSEMSPPQSDPEFYSVTYRAAGAQAGRHMGKNVAVSQQGWSSERRNKTTFLPLSVATLSPEKPPRLQLCYQLNAGLPQSPNLPTIPGAYIWEDALTPFSSSPTPAVPMQIYRLFSVSVLRLVLSCSNSEDQQSGAEASRRDAGREGLAAGSATSSVAPSQSCARVGTEPSLLSWSLLSLPRSHGCWCMCVRICPSKSRACRCRMASLREDSTS